MKSTIEGLFAQLMKSLAIGQPRKRVLPVSYGRIEDLGRLVMLSALAAAPERADHEALDAFFARAQPQTGNKQRVVLAAHPGEGGTVNPGDHVEVARFTLLTRGRAFMRGLRLEVDGDMKNVASATITVTGTAIQTKTASGGNFITFEGMNLRGTRRAPLQAQITFHIADDATPGSNLKVYLTDAAYRLRPNLPDLDMYIGNIPGTTVRISQTIWW